MPFKAFRVDVPSLASLNSLSQEGNGILSLQSALPCFWCGLRSPEPWPEGERNQLFINFSCQPIFSGLCWQMSPPDSAPVSSHTHPNPILKPSHPKPHLTQASLMGGKAFTQCGRHQSGLTRWSKSITARWTFSFFHLMLSLKKIKVVREVL